MPRRAALIRRAERIATAGNTIVALTGLSVTLGWLFGVHELTSFYLSGANVKTNTGISLMGAAVANELLIRARRRPDLILPGRLLACVPLLLGGLTLTEHVVGWNLGIDEMLASEAAGAFATMSPNRMGPPASISFLLIGSALLLIDSPRPGRALVGRGVVLLAVTIALLPLMGYWYGVSPLYAVARFTGVALSTALALLLLELSILAGRPERGPLMYLAREDEVGALIRELLPAALLLPLAAGWLLSEAVQRRVIDGAFGISAMVLILVVGLAALIWRTSSQLARAFDARLAAEQALSASERSLREADRQKNEFLATLSHELRNPLAPMRFAVELLNGPPEIAARARESIGRQIKHMTRLIDDLLDLTRITRNKLQLQRRDVELHTLVHDSVDATLPLIEGAGHRLEVRLPDEPVWLNVDPVRVVQVLTNLLNNAARYTPHGGCIVLEVERRAMDVSLAVRDNGIGLSAEDLARVFDMFVQVGEGARGGLGIGLALTKGLVELHGGTVQAVSAGRDRGSEFRITLPRTTAPAGRASDSPRTVTVASRRVLVVDDNRDAADRLADYLRHRGHDVQVCYDGDEARRTAPLFRPHVALLDIGLPDISGYDLAEHLRAESDGSRLLLIAITGWGQEDDRRAAIAAGFDAHLTKPADPEALLALMEQHAAQIDAGAARA